MAYYPQYSSHSGLEENSYNPRTHFQAAQSNGFHTGGDDSKPRTLYVGNLDPSVTEEFIATLFGQIGIVSKCKVIFDGTNDPYAFVEFSEHNMAAQALQAMNKRQLLEKEMKVNWATEPGTVAKVDTSKHFHVFVGDLSPEIDNKSLKEAFAPFGDISEAKVIKDTVTLKSKGYGFVSYPKREEAERAIEQMNGQWIGRRAIRTNWATRKPNENGEIVNSHKRELNFDDVYNMTTSDNSSVYVGNVAQSASEDDIRQAFARFGTIVEVRVFKAQGYSFVKYDSKDSACRAIVAMSGSDVCGQNVKCSWGKTEFTTKGQGGPGRDNGQQNYWSNYGHGAYGAANQAAAQQQYMQYYENYYKNPQLMQQWQQYYQQQAGQGGANGSGSRTGAEGGDRTGPPAK